MDEIVVVSADRIERSEVCTHDQGQAFFQTENLVN